MGESRGLKWDGVGVGGLSLPFLRSDVQKFNNWYSRRTNQTVKMATMLELGSECPLLFQVLAFGC